MVGPKQPIGIARLEYLCPIPTHAMSMTNWARPSKKVDKPKYMGTTWACSSSVHVVLRGLDFGKPPTLLVPTFHTPPSGGGVSRFWALGAHPINDARMRPN